MLGLVTAVAVAAALACPVECLEVATASGAHDGGHAHSSADEAHGRHGGDPDPGGGDHGHSDGVECCQSLLAYASPSAPELQEPVVSAVYVPRLVSHVPTGARAIALGAWWTASGPAPPGGRYLVLRSLQI